MYSEVISVSSTVVDSGPVCVYCGTTVPNITRDHVVARQFFPAPLPSNLITVPCCPACNDRKREIEEYVCTAFVSHASVLRPHSAAGLVAREKLLKWISKRRKLREHFAKRIIAAQALHPFAEEGIWPAIRIENKRVHPLIEMITQGLIFSLHGLLIPEGTVVKANWDIDDAFLDRFGAPFKTHRFRSGGWGDKVFAYDYLTVGGDPLKSIWLYGFYDVIYASAFVSPTYWTAKARRRARIASRRKKKRSHNRSGSPRHPALRSSTHR